MRNTPDDCGDDTINHMVDFGVLPEREEPGDDVIDLTELDVRYSLCECASPDCRFEARDLKSFDHEPGSTLHLIGTGPTKRIALNDLLQRLKGARSAGLVSIA